MTFTDVSEARTAVSGSRDPVAIAPGSDTVGLPQTKRRAVTRLLKNVDESLWPLASSWFGCSLLRHDVLGTLQFCQHRFRVVLELMSVGRLIHKLL